MIITTLFTITFILFVDFSYASDLFPFVGKWSVNPELTLENSKNSFKYKPGDEEEMRGFVELMKMMTVEIDTNKMVYRWGSGSSAISFNTKEATSTSAIVVGNRKGKDFTLTFALINGQYMNFKSSGSDDMNYYIWQRSSSTTERTSDMEETKEITEGYFESVNAPREPKTMSTEIPGDIWQRVVSDFGPQRADDIYRYLLERIPNGLANGTRPGHLRSILYLAKGDEERLDRYIKMCLSDTRDVMLYAEYEKAKDSKLVRRRDFNNPFDQAQIETD